MIDLLKRIHDQFFKRLDEEGLEGADVKPIIKNIVHGMFDS